LRRLDTHSKMNQHLNPTRNIILYKITYAISN